MQNISGFSLYISTLLFYSKKSSSFSGHNVSFGSGCGVKSDIDSIFEYPTSSINSRLSTGNNVPCQYVSVRSHQRLNQSSIQEDVAIDRDDNDCMILGNVRHQSSNKDGSFSNILKLPYHRNTSSPKLRNRSLKENYARNIYSSNNKSLKDGGHQRIQQRALSFGSSQSSFLGTSPIEKLQTSPPISNQHPHINIGAQKNNTPIRIESDDIILLKTQRNIHSENESHDIIAKPSSSYFSDCQQTPQAQVIKTWIIFKISYIY